jgi:hypothetical protein
MAIIFREDIKEDMFEAIAKFYKEDTEEVLTKEAFLEMLKTTEGLAALTRCIDLNNQDFVYTENRFVLLLCFQE